MDLAHYILSLPLLLLVTLRMLGIFLVAPVFSHVAVPVQVRVFLAVAIGLAVAGQVDAPLYWPGSAAGLLAAGAMELCIGAVIGYAARLVFAGIEMGAVYISQQMGVGIIEALNPMAEDQSGTVRQLFGLLAIVIFLAIGGHRDLLGGALGTFHAAPVVSQADSSQLLAMIAGLLKASFKLAMDVASPVLISLILTTVAMGMLQRSIPQLNVFSIGFPVYAMLGLIVLAAAIAILPHLLRSAWMLSNRDVTAWLKTIS